MKYTKRLHEFLANNLDVDFSSIAVDGEVYTPSDIYSVLLGEISRLQAENRWIPVSERLPEDNDYVIVTGNGIVSVGYFDSVMWWSADDLRLPFEPEKWRPLPPAPEGED